MDTSIIKQPVITEKSLLLANKSNIYTFEVIKEASKPQVAAAIKALFNVVVLSVHTVRRPKVVKATGKRRLKTVGAITKKALVTLKKGQTIDLFDIGGNDHVN